MRTDVTVAVSTLFGSHKQFWRLLRFLLPTVKDDALLCCVELDDEDGSDDSEKAVKTVDQSPKYGSRRILDPSMEEEILEQIAESEENRNNIEVYLAQH